MLEEIETFQRIYAQVTDLLVAYSFQLFGALVIVAAGFIVGNWVARALSGLQERRNVDATLRQFIASSGRIIVIAMFAIIAINKLGVSITPLIAAVGGLAVGASFAIQGPVSNYGAGLVIILTRMFKVGDTITVQNCAGVVAEISLAQTHLIAEDGEIIIIPNKHVVGEIHRNSFANRLVEGHICISYDDDPDIAIACIDEILQADNNVSDKPATHVGINAFDEIGMLIGYRYWVPTLDFFQVQYAVNLALYRALADRGVTIARPQQTVHLVSAA